MRLSVLVVSRTPELLSHMLGSLAAATNLSSEQLEILCSWNGSEADEQAIENHSDYELLIAQREPYHFASNMNALAEKATGDFLLLINDDVQLDPGCIDAAIAVMQQQASAGLVGARLRDAEGLLTHAGIVFDSRHSPYHQLDRKLGSEHAAVLGEPRAVPAVTGALMLIRREHFQSLRFATDFKVCGEDVELCLDLRERLGLEVIYAPGFSGLHGGEATRSQVDEQSGNSEDLSRMRARYQRFLAAAGQAQLRVELAAKVAEVEALRSLEAHRKHESAQISRILGELEERNSDTQWVKRDQLTEELTEELLEKHATQLKTLQENVLHWQQQAHALQLARMRLEQELKHAQRGA